MAISLTADVRPNPRPAPWLEPAVFWSELNEATSELDPPFGVLHLGALRYNAHDMVRRAAGTRIRLATKSVRVRDVIHAVLALPGYQGVLAYTLAEALWLAETVDDVVVGYPMVDRASLVQLAASADKARRITLMIDSVDQLDMIDSLIAADRREVIRVCLELDLAWDGPPPLGRVGVWRSPIRTPEDAAALAHHIVGREGFALVGLMGYEAQVAGLGDRIPGRKALNASVRWMQKRSVAEIRERRAEAVRLIQGITQLEFVNGGGTGSIEYTSGDDSVTEIAAGSGLFAGHTFDNFSAFTPAPAASFAMSVVRKPQPEIATVLGGGWPASGPPGVDRLPKLSWPEGLEFVAREMAGEVQTPVAGRAAASLKPGDRVWFRHAKSGELSERINEFVVVDGGRIVDRLPSYRGEGRVFL